jgi:hypothetical protein
MVRSSFCGARRRRSLALVLCLLLAGAPGIGITCEETSSPTADAPLLLCVGPPAPGKPRAADFSSKAGGRSEVELDQRNRAGNSPPDGVPDKHQLFMMLLMLRSTKGRYPFLALR